MKVEFPKTIYVTRDQNSDGATRKRNEDLLAWPTRDASGEDDDAVAIYALVAVKTLRITHNLI